MTTGENVFSTICDTQLRIKLQGTTLLKCSETGHVSKDLRTRQKKKKKGGTEERGKGSDHSGNDAYSWFYGMSSRKHAWLYLMSDFGFIGRSMHWFLPFSLLFMNSYRDPSFYICERKEEQSYYTGGKLSCLSLSMYISEMPPWFCATNRVRPRIKPASSSKARHWWSYFKQ